MPQRIKLRAFVVLLAVLTAEAARASGPPQSVVVRLTPSVIPMGTFYSGAKVHVEGTVPLDAQVIIAFRGPEVTEVFNQVGRAGPIWVNTGKVSISGIPSLLLVFSSKRVCDCLCREEIDRGQFDAVALKNKIKIKPLTKNADLVAGEFLKLKYRQGSYQLDNGGVELADAEEQRAAYTLDFVWPRSAPPGTYLVRVCACQGGNISDSLEIPLQVVEIGFPAMVADLAKERPATYGIISVVIAVLAGFGIDFLTTRIFKKKISAH
ncbi:MAG TPA: TIGR02186 family protein [Terriglobia bacterium]|nr:TIGR02186 family protein [Terriglobia bacterium]